jgi:subtilisin family serine protease
MSPSSRAVVVAGLLATLLALPASAEGSARSGRARYIVVLEGSVDAVAQTAVRQTERLGTSPFHVYRQALDGYAARLTAEQAARLASNPTVAFVERDRRVSASGTQAGAPWGLDRIDQRSRPIDGTFSYANTGAGVKAYVIDTGIRQTHQELAGRVIGGVDYVNGGPAQDCSGHGTHVAGTIGGTTYGVAKAVTLVPVRVLDCLGMGWLSDVVAGVNWVKAQHLPGQAAVANMSLGGPPSKALNRAMREAILDGVTFTVAAGNAGQDACRFSPANVRAAITVSATNRMDGRPWWADYGDCVDWFAPGRDITSAWVSSDVATRTLTGTSMAAPHVAGVAALYLESHPTAAPGAVRNALFALTTREIVTHSRTPSNHLLFTDL